ncbi:MAG: hypothetical protein ACRD96_17455, partial [Bryobacteraceae bacterium]
QTASGFAPWIPLQVKPSNLADVYQTRRRAEPQLDEKKSKASEKPAGIRPPDDLREATESRRPSQ